MSVLKFRANGADRTVKTIQKAAFIYLQTFSKLFYSGLCKPEHVSLVLLVDIAWSAEDI